MITSPHNEKLKLLRKLHERKYREREGLFASEGEDLLEAGLAAGARPRFVLSAAGCELIQGYLFSPPLRAAGMTGLLRQGVIPPPAARRVREPVK